MRVAQRIPKRIREDEYSFKLRIEHCEWGKWWKRSPGTVNNKLLKKKKGRKRTRWDWHHRIKGKISSQTRDALAVASGTGKKKKMTSFIIRKHKCFQQRLGMKVKSLSRVQLFVTPWTVAYQDPLSMGFSRQEYWSGVPFPSPGDAPDPRIEPESPSL